MNRKVILTRQIWKKEKSSLKHKTFLYVREKSWYILFKPIILNMPAHTASWTLNTSSQRKWKQTVVACETTLLVKKIKNKRCWGLFKENISSHLAPGLWSRCLSHKALVNYMVPTVVGRVGLASRLPCNGAASLIKIALVSEALIQLVWKTN